MRFPFGLSLFAASLLTTAVVAEPHVERRNHDALARRALGEVNLHKRFSNTRFTYYAVGLGACGQTNVPSDFIVALNTPQFGSGYPGPNCFKSITIQYGGKTAQATIMDECPGCPYGGLDFSTGLFQFFAAESIGVLYGQWWFDSGSGGGGGGQPTTTTTPWQPPQTTTWYPPATTSTSTWYPPSTTSTWYPPPSSSSTWSPPPSSSSTWSPPPSSSSSSSHSTTSSTSSTSSTPSTTVSSINFSSGVASGLAVPSGIVAPGTNVQNIISINQIVVALGGLIVAARG